MRIKRENDYPTNTTVDIPTCSSIRDIKYLTLCGGGMKGLAYLGSIYALERHGVLNQLEAVAGSSAGGFAALLLAIGCSPDELRSKMEQLDFRSLQDKREPGWVEAMHVEKFFGPGIPNQTEKIAAIQDSLNASQIKAVDIHYDVNRANRLEHLYRAEDLVKLAFGSNLGLYEGDAVCDQLRLFLAESPHVRNPNITFGQLKELVELKGPPLKNLVLTGSNLSTGKLEYYSAETTPDMPIFLAARITSSFPGAFKPVEITTPDGKKHVKVDGGLLENLPDVFNHPPYCPPDRMNAHHGNRHAFALGFKPKEKRKSIHGMVGLAKSLYSAALSVNNLIEKYENNIALIDPVNVGTLEFNASEGKKKRLIHSGEKGVDKAFKKIIASEKRNPVDHAELSPAELVRREIALEIKHRSDPEDIEVQTELLAIQQDIQKKKLRKSHVEKLRKANREKVEKRKRAETQPASPIELAGMCRGKIEELKVLNTELRGRREDLVLVQASLFEYTQNILSAFKNDEGFRLELADLRESQVQLNKIKIESYYSEKSHIPKVIEAEYKLEWKIKSLMHKYQNHDALAYFYGEVFENVKDPRYVIPTRIDSLFAERQKDQQACAQLINEIDGELDQQEARIRTYQRQLALYSEEEGKSSRYADLVKLKSSLDRAIYKKTTLLTKIHNYFYRQGPARERIARPVLQIIAYIAYGALFLPKLPARTRQVILYLNSRKKRDLTGFRKLLKSMGPEDLDKNFRMQTLREAAGIFVQKISDNYSDMDSAERSYLFKLFALQMEQSGVSLEEILEKKAGESDVDFLKRAELLGKRLADFAPQPINLSEKAANNQLDQLLKNVLGDFAVHFVQQGTKSERQRADIQFLSYIDSKIDLDMIPVLSLEKIERYLTVSARIGASHEKARDRFRGLYSEQIKKIEEVDPSDSQRHNKYALHQYQRAKRKDLKTTSSVEAKKARKRH